LAALRSLPYLSPIAALVASPSGRMATSGSRRASAIRPAHLARLGASPQQARSPSLPCPPPLATLRASLTDRMVISGLPKTTATRLAASLLAARSPSLLCPPPIAALRKLLLDRMVISGLRNFWATELAGSVLDREANGEGLARLLARIADLEDFSKLNRMIRAASISHTRRPFH